MCRNLNHYMLTRLVGLLSCALCMGCVKKQACLSHDDCAKTETCISGNCVPASQDHPGEAETDEDTGSPASEVSSAPLDSDSDTGRAPGREPAQDSSTMTETYSDREPPIDTSSETDTAGQPTDQIVGPCENADDCDFGRCLLDGFCAQPCASNEACGVASNGFQTYCSYDADGQEYVCVPGCNTSADCDAYAEETMCANYDTIEGILDIHLVCIVAI